MRKNKTIIILIVFVILLFIICNKSVARYYETLDTIKVRFTIEENINTGVNEDEKI